MSGLQMEPVICKGLGQEFAYIKAKYWHIILGQDAIAFQVEVVATLNCATSYLRNRLVKEQTAICTESQVAVAALGASRTKSLFVEDCIEKLTALSEVGTWA